jgi:hypothetical protein
MQHQIKVEVYKGTRQADGEGSGSPASTVVQDLVSTRTSTTVLDMKLQHRQLQSSITMDYSCCLPSYLNRIEHKNAARWNLTGDQKQSPVSSNKDR